MGQRGGVFADIGALLQPGDPGCSPV